MKTLWTIIQRFYRDHTYSETHEGKETPVYFVFNGVKYSSVKAVEKAIDDTKSA